MASLLSIVIPVRDGGDTLDEQLVALAAAAAQVGDIEVIVSDNGSLDDTLAVVRRHMGALDLRVVDSGDAVGINHARNCGVRVARGERIILCDADDVVGDDWLVAIVEAFDEGHDLVGGPIDYVRLNTPEVRAWRGAQRAAPATMLDFLPSGHGANLGFTRALFDRLEGFDEAFSSGGDDVEFCWRAQLAGADLHVAPEAIVHYRLRSSYRALWRQWIGYGSSEAMLFKHFGSAGLQRRPAMAFVRDVWWLGTRCLFSWPSPRRGAWLRRSALAVGRVRGAFAQRILWW